MAIKKAITLITILKKDAEKDEDKLKYFLVKRLVEAIQKELTTMGHAHERLEMLDKYFKEEG